ncbi:hypothetical protein CH063_13851 [Colletotrichum higginsianum]|uniref:Uncharacterized protein n=1 Tax=Colletotrichum higginsianum (strain IMI 349063) TaxID=759273 RepID=H1VW51_COLHI|nr:hypothetical protein CH063_13851 [Colletotrichum higginsianum]
MVSKNPASGKESGEGPPCCRLFTPAAVNAARQRALQYLSIYFCGTGGAFTRQPLFLSLLCRWFLFFIWFYRVPSSNQQFPSAYPYPRITCPAALLALGVLYACQASTTGVGSLRFNRYSYPQYLPAVRSPILRWPP